MREYGEDAAEVLLLIKDGKDTIEELIQNSNMSAAKITASLGALEIEGLIRVEGEYIYLLKN